MVIVAGLLLGLFTTSAHVKARGLDYIEYGEQLTRHQNVMEGRAGNPWQYRVLAPYMVNGALKLSERLNVPHHVAVSFIGFRVILDTLVLLLAFAYYRKLGLNLPFALISGPCQAEGVHHSLEIAGTLA